MLGGASKSIPSPGGGKKNITQTQTPIAYAITNDKSEEDSQFYQYHEGLCSLPPFTHFLYCGLFTFTMTADISCAPPLSLLSFSLTLLLSLIVSVSVSLSYAYEIFWYLGVQFLTWNSLNFTEFRGCDLYLRAIHNRTNPYHRIGKNNNE